MTFKINATVLTPAEIIAGLDVDADTGLKLAREVATNARRELEHATRRLSDAGAIVSSAKVAVAEGRASTGDLEAALRSQTVAALVLPQHQARLDDAERAIIVALKHAKASVVTEAGRRRDGLQATADKLAPVLNALRDGEGALDAAVQAALGDRYTCVEAITWPRSNEDDAVQSHGRDLSRQVNIPVNPTYPVRPPAVIVPSQ